MTLYYSGKTLNIALSVSPWVSGDDDKSSLTRVTELRPRLVIGCVSLVNMARNTV